MVTFTSRAAEKVRQMRSELPAAANKLRLSVESGGCSGMQYGMSFDEAKEGDLACESEGVAIVVDASSAAHLKGCSVDFDDGLHGKGFEIKNPNAKSTCGCGKSFN